MSQEVFQPLSEQLQADYELAEQLAFEAIEVAYRVKELSRELITDGMDYDEPEVRAEAMAGIMNKRNDAVGWYQDLRAATEDLMPYPSAFRTEESEAAQSIEPFASAEVWGAMTPEQKVKAAAVRSAIAEGPLKKQGVIEETLRVVQTEKDGESKFVLVHTGAGVDIGKHSKDYDPARSYDSVMSGKNDKLFQVEVDGVSYDTRSGMTDEAYEAKVEDARNRNVTLPDSRQLKDETGDLWTWTMLTGEPVRADGSVQVRFVDDGRVYRGVAGPGNDYRALRVCPAVVIE